MEGPGERLGRSDGSEGVRKFETDLCGMVTMTRILETEGDLDKKAVTSESVTRSDQGLTHT